MVDVYLKKINEQTMQVMTKDENIFDDLYEHFSFDAPGAEYDPRTRGKHKRWDGKIHLISKTYGTTYTGLKDQITSYCKDKQLIIKRWKFVPSFTKEQINKFIDEYPLNPTYKIRDYQRRAIIESIINQRQVIISVTSSGKTLICFFISQFIRKYVGNCLIVVPKIGLVKQIISDFKDYSQDDKFDIQALGNGAKKKIKSSLVVSTWQSVFRLDPEWFAGFQAVIGDEAHNYKAKSLITLFSSLYGCPYRIGLTGTLDGKKVNELVIEGLFGPPRVYTTTRMLMDRDEISKLKLRTVRLNYSDKTCENFINSDYDYPNEISFIINNSARNDFIVKLVQNLKGNTVVFFHKREHGRLLYDLIRNNTNSNVYYADGTVDIEDREALRPLVETESDAIIVASYGTFSEGISIKRLNNAIITHPTKSIVRLLQTIGRMLRKSEFKEVANIYDLWDNLQWNEMTGHTVRHYNRRKRIYKQEEFDVEHMKYWLEENNENSSS